MTRAELETICAAIRVYRAKARRLDNLKTWLEAQRDAALLPTTRSIYQAIIDRVEGGE